MTEASIPELPKGLYLISIGGLSGWYTFLYTENVLLCRYPGPIGSIAVKQFKDLKHE